MRKFNDHIRRTYKRVIKFILTDIWHLDMSELGKMKAKLIKYLKLFLITIEGFTSDKVALQATSLSFFTAMSVVPFVAIMFAITNGFGASERLESLLFNYFNGNQEVIKYILSFASNTIEASKNGLFGIITLIFLISTIILLMLNIEKAFNEIWKLESGRSFKKRVLYYFTLLFVAPLIMFLFLTIALLYTNTLNSIGLQIDRYLPLTSIFSWLSAYIFIVGVFTVMYKFIPNTKVKISAAFNSALILAFAFIVVQFLYLETQIMVTGLNTIYGVFAAIPLFMVWMNISWTIILFGVELSHAFQNIDKYKYI